MEGLKSIRQALSADLKKVRMDCSIKNWISAIVLNQSFKRIMLYRFEHAVRNKMLKMLLGGVSRLLSTCYNVYICPDAEIGNGFCIGHCFSIIISTCKIGNNVTIMQQVTIGSSRGGKRSGYPTIGNNVFVGCGAKIIGEVTIGDNVTIGANALVVTDIPSGTVVGGVPAKVLNHKGEEQVKHWTSDLSDYMNLMK